MSMFIPAFSAASQEQDFEPSEKKTEIDFLDVLRMFKNLPAPRYGYSEQDTYRRLLDVAVINGNELEVSKIINNTDIRSLNEGQSILFTACMANQVAVAKLLIKKDPSLIELENNLSTTDDRYYYSYSDRSAKPNGTPCYQTFCRATPLHAAVFIGNLELVHLTAPRRGKELYMCSLAFEEALETGQEEIALWFINKGIDLKQRIIDKPEVAAISGGCLESLKAMINKGVSTNGLIRRVAWKPKATDKHSQILRYLLSVTAREDLNEIDDYGYTPLVHAAEMGNLELVKILIEAGAEFKQTFRGLNIQQILEKQQNQFLEDPYLENNQKILKERLELNKQMIVFFKSKE